MPSFLDNALFPQGKDDTLVSPRADIYSESTKINYPNVSKVITKVVIKPTDLSEELECAICSDIMVSPVNLICGHTFCEACVTPWLDTNKVSHLGRSGRRNELTLTCISKIRTVQVAGPRWTLPQSEAT